MESSKQKRKKKSCSIIKYVFKTEITEQLSNDQTGILRQRIVCMQSLMSTDRKSEGTQVPVTCYQSTKWKYSGHGKRGEGVSNAS